MRNGLAADAPHVSLLLYPGKTDQIEAPNWHARLLAREKSGVPTVVKNMGPGLTEPVVTHGRLTGYCWLRLQRKGDRFTSFVSNDGNSWIELGNVSLPLRKTLYVGLTVCSGMPNSTTIQFDQVSISEVK